MMSRKICRKAIQLLSSSSCFRYERVLTFERFTSDAAAAAGAAGPELSGATPVAPCARVRSCRLRSACSLAELQISSCWNKYACLRCRSNICESSFYLLHSLCCKARGANGLDPADFSRVSRADRVRALVRGGAIVACEMAAAAEQIVLL
jgi:hypothetical protein